jgi:hypothetical protein
LGARQTWRAASLRGTDFIVARDGKIVALYLFFDQLT